MSLLGCITCHIVTTVPERPLVHKGRRQYRLIVIKSNAVLYCTSKLSLGALRTHLLTDSNVLCTLSLAEGLHKSPKYYTAMGYRAHCARRPI